MSYWGAIVVYKRYEQKDKDGANRDCVCYFYYFLYTLHI